MEVDKTEYCHRLADFHETMYEIEQAIADIESRLRWDDESRREWYLERLEERKSQLAEINREYSAFICEYGAVFST